MKTLASLAVLTFVGLTSANADMCAPTCPPEPCEPPCPAMMKTECVPMVRVEGPCCTTKCCPEVQGIFGTYIFGKYL